MVTDFKFEYYVEKLKKLISKKKLKSLQITASLDCWGPQAEYIRTGLDLNQWEKNFKKLIELKFIKLQINLAINVLSIKYMPELFQKIKEWNKKHKVYISFMTVNTPTFLNPDIFDSDLFTKDFETILENFPNETDFDTSSFEYLKGIKKQIESSPKNLDQIKKLFYFINELDRRRNTDYKLKFPWLVDEFKKHKIL